MTYWQKDNLPQHGRIFLTGASFPKKPKKNREVSQHEEVSRTISAAACAKRIYGRTDHTLYISEQYKHYGYTKPDPTTDHTDTESEYAAFARRKCEPEHKFVVIADWDHELDRQREPERQHNHSFRRC